MSITPSVGRRGSYPVDSTSSKRLESILRLWTFLSGLSTKTLTVYGNSPVAGKMLVAENDDGDCTYSSTLPATSIALTGQTASATATLVTTASGEYSVTICAECTTASAGTGILYGSLSYTDDIGAVTLYPLVGIPTNATGRDQAVVMLRCSGGGIDYTFAISGTGTPTYAGFVNIVKVR